MIRCFAHSRYQIILLVVHYITQVELKLVVFLLSSPTIITLTEHLIHQGSKHTMDASKPKTNASSNAEQAEPIMNSHGKIATGWFCCYTHPEAIDRSPVSLEIYLYS